MKQPTKRPMPAGEAPPSAVPAPRGQAGGVTLLWCLLGLLMPRAALYGQMTPFGVSLAAAADKPVLPVLLALAVGYLLGDSLSPMRYIAALAAVGGIRWVLAAVPEWRERTFFAPLVAFGATVTTGFALYSATGLDGYRVLLLLAESGVAAGCAWFFRVTVIESRRLATGEITDGLRTPQQAACILTGAVLLMASATVTIGAFSLGRVLAALLILVLARAGQEQGGSMAGVIVGAATALSVAGQTALALGLAFGGLLAGVFSRFGRLAQTAAFLVAAAILALADTSDEVPVRLYELFAACVLFLVLPARFDRWLHRLVLRGRESPAVEGVRRAVTMRLQMAAGTLEEVGETVGVVTERLAQHSAPDTCAIAQECCRTVCAACPLHALCWVENADETHAALLSLTPILRRDGQITPDKLTGAVAKRCCQPERLTEYINRRYEQYIVRESAWRRLGEIQHTLNDQFSGMAGLLSSIADDMRDPRQVDVELSGRVAAVCADHGMPVRQALCVRTHGNRLMVDILAVDVGIRLSGSRWLRDMQTACGCVFATPTAVPCGDDVRITLCEPSRYAVELGVAQHCCDGEKLCGDAIDHFTLNGRTVLLLSDGMGSGGRAAGDGAMAVGLTSRLWQAGFSPDSILHSVNAALLVKSREESLATLDVAVIDTFSGRLDSYKAGAATTLLCSGGRVSRLERASLPIGILTDIHFEHSADWLHDGDILLLMSDGAMADGLAPVEELLRDHPAGEDMQTLAERIAHAAHDAQGQHPDDITVMAARLRLDKT